MLRHLAQRTGWGGVGGRIYLVEVGGKEGDLLARSCASCLRVCLGSSCSDSSTLGGGLLRTLLLGTFSKCYCTA